jgi:3',5'-cyclic AMP phosphodiesterase CpdA
MRAMLQMLVQFSDTHLCPPGRRVYGRIDTARLLDDAVAAVQRLPLHPAALLLTGDLADDGSAAAYALLRERLSPLACPLWPLAGNHDDRAALRAAFADIPEVAASASLPWLQYEARLEGLRVLVLDTLEPGASHGVLCAERLGWLAQQLARDQQTPVLLALHHPPFQTHLPGMDAIALREGAFALEALVQQHPQVQRVVCGHLHRSVLQRWAGTVVQSAPSTAHQIALALGTRDGDGWTLEPPGFLVHVWRAGGALVTHQASSAPHPGPQGWGDAT